MHYSQIYELLNQEDLRRVAACCSLMLDDVRQEALLICVEIASGEGDYDPGLGTLPQYVLGKLWGMTLRWQNPLPVLESESDDVQDELLLQRLMADMPWYDADAGDPLAQLAAREEEEAYQAHCDICMQQLDAGRRTFVELFRQGLPIEIVAEIYGMTPRAVRYRMAELVG